MRELEKLSALTELQYQTGQQELRALTQEESRLRRELERLKAQNREVDAVGVNIMNSVGADILWRSWVGRMRTQLNTQLAQVLSKKERFLARARRDYSRVLVTQELAEKQVMKTRAAKAKKTLGETIETSLMQRFLDDQ